MPNKQSFENHVRWHPPFHFVLFPILALNLIFAIVRLVQDYNVDRIAYLVVAAALIMLALIARVYGLKVQDRVIRLEEELRYRRLLPEESADRAIALPMNRIIALRFADDAELPALVERTLADEFEKPIDIKRAIKTWRADDLRV